MNDKINDKNYLPLTPFKGWVLENFPFIEADFDAITNYELICQVTKYLNEVIHNQNEVQDLASDLVQGYNELVDFVNNYFENLDVQDEINKKLDELVEDGTLTNLIKDYINPIQNAFETTVNSSLATMQSQINSIASGSPAGVYATLSDLETADPNHSNIYLVTANGNWYYYNTENDEWTSGGTYQSTGISDNSIDIEKVNDTFKEQINIVPFTYYQAVFSPANYDPSDYSTGLVGPNTKRMVTNIIDVHKGDTLYLSNGWEMVIHLFDDELNMVLEGTGWITPSKMHFGENLKLAFQIRKNDNSNFDIADLDYQVIRLVRNDFNLYELNENEIELPYNKYSFIENGNLFTNFKSQRLVFTTIPNAKKLCYNLGKLTQTQTAVNIIIGEDADYYYSAFFGYGNGNSKIRKYAKGTTYSSPVTTDISITYSIPEVISNYKAIAEIKNNRLLISVATKLICDVDISSLNITPILGFITLESYENKANAKNIECDFDVDKLKPKENTVDLLVFAGQSNIAGRGVSANAPAVNKNAGYEFKAISDPTRLYIIEEPFGYAENNAGGISDGTSKTGSLVSAFANYYYDGKVPIIGVSASKGGTSISQWQSDGLFLPDLLTRYNLAKTYLEQNNYKIRHKYVIWCQGETDGDHETSETDYKNYFNDFVDDLIDAGIEKILLIRIGNYNGNNSSLVTSYKNIIEYQTDIAKENQNVIMISTDFAGMKDRNLMKDDYHYTQDGYNECGMYAGINANIYASTQKETTMYDPEYNNLYYSYKN